MRTEPDLDGPFVRRKGSARGIPLRTRLVYPKALREAMDRSLDRYIERWARGLLLVIDGEVRKLTEEEVQDAVNAGKSDNRRESRAKRKQKG
jgi:hypothetical protein